MAVTAGAESAGVVAVSAGAAAVSAGGAVSAAGPATSPMAVTAGAESADVASAGAASAASVGDDTDEDSCEDGELDPIELPESDEDSCELGELDPIELLVELPVPDVSPELALDEELSDGPHPPGSARLIAGVTVPAANAAVVIAAIERRRHECSRRSRTRASSSSRVGQRWMDFIQPPVSGRCTPARGASE
jgi:hypothetical protein